MSELHSMTGFAALEGVLPERGRSFGLTIKSVNHRHLDLSVRLVPGLDALEPALRSKVKEHVRRGHVELTLVLEKSSAGAVQLDHALLQEHVALFRQAAQSQQLAQQPDLNTLLRLPGVLVAAPAEVRADAVEPAVLGLLEQLLQRFNSARKAEGEALGSELRSSMDRLSALTHEAASLREGAAAMELSRLRSRLAELLAGADVSEDRLLTEAALLAARSDVEEELVRLRTHIARFHELLDAGGEVGRPLDFLLQEMNREANTALSKSGGNSGESGLRLTDIGLAMKVELERAREQVQNLE